MAVFKTLMQNHLNDPQLLFDLIGPFYTVSDECQRITFARIDPCLSTNLSQLIFFSSKKSFVERLCPMTSDY